MAELYRVSITDRALSDLTSVSDYIRLHSPQNAAVTIERILDEIDGLDRMPSRFRVAARSRKRGSAVHAMIVRPFIVYYRIDEPARCVFVLEVIHGARRQPRKFD
jgi:plasmid stabilization system protein ParE